MVKFSSNDHLQGIEIWALVESDIFNNWWSFKCIFQFSISTWLYKPNWFVTGIQDVEVSVKKSQFLYCFKTI